MKIQFALLFAILFSQSVVNAQSGFWKSKDAYLGQKPPGDTPVKLEISNLLDSGFIPGRCAFSEDGKTFLYSYSSHFYGFDNTGTKSVHFDGKEWAKPVTIAERMISPTLMPGGNSLLLAGQGSKVFQLQKEEMDGVSLKSSSRKITVCIT